MDDIRGMIDRLPDLSETELGDLEQSIVQAFETVEAQDLSQDTVAEMTFLADSAESVRAELAAREAQKAELAAQASEAASRIASDEAVAAEESPETSAAPPETFATTEAPETEAVVADGAEVTEAPETEAVVADGSEVTETPETEAAVAEVEESEVPETEAAVAEVEEVTEVAETEAAVAEVPETTETEAAVAEVTEPVDAPETEAAMADVEESDAPEPVMDEDEDDEDGDETEPVFASSEDATTTSAEAQMGTTAVEPTFSAPADRLPVQRTGAESVPVSLVAGGDIPGITAGASLEGREALAEAMSMRLHSLRRASGGKGEQVVVASLVAAFPEERTLRGKESDSNSEKIQSIVEPKAVVAAGGWCAPLPVSYDLFNVGESTATPVRDSLPVFNADRGGIRYVTPPRLEDYAGSFGIWTNQDDIDAANPGDPSPTKPCLMVSCAAEVEVYLEAITMCLCFTNLQTRAFPELIARHNELALVYAARASELHMLNQIKSHSDAVDIPDATLGTARDVLIAVERAAVAMRYQQRLDPDVPLRFLAPNWLRAMVRSDLTAQLPGDGMDTTFSLTDGNLDGFFANRNIRPVWAMEGLGDLPTAEDYPDSVEWALYPEGTFTLLDGGTLDIGIVRDMNLVQTNDYCMFTEEFLAVAKSGTASLWVTQALNVNGGSAGTLDVSTVDF